jgi:hypothetical protein
MATIKKKRGRPRVYSDAERKRRAAELVRKWKERNPGRWKEIQARSRAKRAREDLFTLI